MVRFCKTVVVRIWARLLIILLALALLHGQPLSAGETSRDFDRWLAELKKEAISQGVPTAIVEAALTGVTLREEVLKRDRNQPEFKLTLAAYLKRIVSEQRVAKGRRMLGVAKVALRAMMGRD